MGLLDSVIEAAKQQYQTTKRGFGLLASNPQQFAQEATTRYFPTKEEEAQFAQAQAAGGDYTQTPYYQKVMNLSQFQGSIKPTGLLNAAHPDVKGLNAQPIFHGTSGSHTSLSSNYAGSVSSGDGRGFWFSKDLPYAGEYAENAAGKRGGNPRIMKALPKLSNPLQVKFNDMGQPMVGKKVMDWKSNSDAIDYALKKKHDGIDWVDGSFTDDPSVTIFDSSKIKFIDQGF